MRSLAGFDTVCVAAVQATPVILDADATIDKAVGLIGEAADDGATLVVFPECFVSVYPSGAWAAQAAMPYSAGLPLWYGGWGGLVVPTYPPGNWRGHTRGTWPRSTNPASPYTMSPWPASPLGTWSTFPIGPAGSFPIGPAGSFPVGPSPPPRSATPPAAGPRHGGTNAPPGRRR